MRKILTPNLDATIKADPVPVEMDLELQRFQLTLEVFFEEKLGTRAPTPEQLEKLTPEQRESVEAFQREITEARAAAEAYKENVNKEERPWVEIGFVPMEYVTDIRQRHQSTSDARDLLEKLRGVVTADRELARWGMRSWNLGPGQTAMPMEEILHRGRARKVASPEAVDIIERNGLLRAVAKIIWEYNDLTTAEKKT